MNSKRYLIALAVLCSLYFSGCKKDAQPTIKDSSSLIKSNTANEETVLTPGGLMPKSHVFLIEPGYHLSVNNGEVLKVRDFTNETVSVLGKTDQSVNPSNSGQGLFNQNNKAHLPGQAPSAPYPNAWQAYSFWHGSSTGNITSFSTTWTVPNAPVTNTGNNQLIYMFEGTSNDAQTDIIQPVLQWGYNGKFGSTSGWTIANWYLWGNNSYAAYSTAIVGISSGTSLQGTITYNGTASSGYSYTSSFTGHSTSNMTVSIGNIYNNVNAAGTITLPTISLQTWVYEALESYHWNGSAWVSEVSNITDYPAFLSAPMKSISVTVNGSAPSPFNWTTGTGTATYGEHAVDVSDNITGSGEVDLKINAPAINFDVSSNNADVTDFSLWVNSINESGPRGVSSSNPIVIAGTGASGSSTVQMQVSFGYMPTSATMYAPAPINGVISGSNVTFSGVNLSTAGTVSIVIN